MGLFGNKKNSGTFRLITGSNYFIQNQYFNGWKHGHFVNSLFIFTPDGKIYICVLNAPGIFQDSTMADYSVHKFLEKIFLETSVKVVVDSAFKLGDREFLVRSSQNLTGGACHEIVQGTVATSMRHLSEWGM